MAGFIPIRELEARRQALVGESEVYRQTLLLEVMNLRLAGAETRRQLGSTLRPWLVVLAPLGALIGMWRDGGAPSKGPPRKRGMLGKALLLYRLYRRFGPVLQPWLAQLVASFQSPPVAQPAADVSSSIHEQPV